eukprot:scaffold26631_cov49-Attheya_sp.AAC.1
MNMLLCLTLTLTIIGTTFYRYAAPAGPVRKSVTRSSTASANISIYTLWLKWQELSRTQKQSLEARGFTEKEWDDEDEEFLWYDVLYWHEIWKEEQDSLSAIGWTQELWNAKKNNLKEITFDIIPVDWDELSHEHKRSLRARGFTEEEWDEKEVTELLWYDVLFWNELDEDEEKTRLLIALGWNQEMWDDKITGGLALGMASSAFRPWNMLLPEEQEEAMALGFDSSTWNFVDIGEESTCGNNSKSSDFAN